MEHYYQPEIECASREQIQQWQDERLVKQVEHVWNNVPYYRAKMEAKGLTPKDIDSEDDCYDYDPDTRTLKNEQGAVYYRQIVE